MSSGPPDIFDRHRRKALRERARQRSGHDNFISQYIAEEFAERLSVVSRDFENVAFIGPVGVHAGLILGDRQVRSQHFGLGHDGVEEDRLPFAPASFDLIISGGTLDSVNDLPGALIQIRRALRPDGLFLGHLFGAGTLATLKNAMLAADGDAVSPHIHPQIDLRSAADLLSRAGFTMPVADQDLMTVAYRDWRKLVADLRDTGVTNALAGLLRYPGKNYPQRLDSAWAISQSEDGKVNENFTHIHLSGWAPSPDQPKPAKRGSGVSLTQILQKPDDH